LLGLWSRRPRVRVPSLTPPKLPQTMQVRIRGILDPAAAGSYAGSNFGSHALIACMTRSRRANGAGNVYIKHGQYYGRWYTLAGGRTNRKLGPVRRPGSASGLTRAQAEKRLRAIMDEVQVSTEPGLTVATAGVALLAQLEARGSSRSHRETVESHIRVHLVPYFEDKSLDRISEEDVTRLLVRLRRLGRAPKTIRNIASTLHSLFELAVRRRWVAANPCKQVDLPAVPASGDVRFLTHDELRSVLERGMPDDQRAKLDRALYLTAAMTGLRQGELLALRWRDLDVDALKLRVRQAFVRGSSSRRNRFAGSEVFRWRTRSATRSRTCACIRCSPRTTTSCSGIRSRARRSTARRSASGSSAPAAAPVCG
jgi:hypothetical protein